MTEDERLDTTAQNEIAAALNKRWGYVSFTRRYRIAREAIAAAKPSPELAEPLDDLDAGDAS